MAGRAEKLSEVGEVLVAKGLDVNWSEGLFILPHHFQQNQLQIQQLQTELLRDFQPHYYGFGHLKIADGDCENHIFRAAEFDCRLPDGTRLTFPGNCQVEAREFKEALDGHGGELEVYLGLPTSTELEPNCLRFNQQPMGGMRYRHITRMVEVQDYSTGKNPQQVEAKLYNPKILFQGEPQFGYDCLKIAVIERSAKYGSTPKIKRESPPPLINIRASLYLTDILRETTNRLLAKNRQLRAFWNSKGTSAFMKLKEALKVQAIAQSSAAFRQLNCVDRLHPFTVYLKMVELIGMLSIYSFDDRIVDPPEYDHNHAATCFKKVEHFIIELLALLEESSYESRVFRDAEGMLTCDLDRNWLEPKFELYIGFESAVPVADVMAAVSELKVAPQDQIAMLNLRRLRGMQLDGPLPHVEGLPKTNDMHVFHLSRNHPLFTRLKDQEQPSLAVSGDYQFSKLTTLYVLQSQAN